MWSCFPKTEDLTKTSIYEAPTWVKGTMYPPPSREGDVGLVQGHPAQVKVQGPTLRPPSPEPRRPQVTLLWAHRGLVSPGHHASLGHIREVHPVATECALPSLLASVPWQLASAWKECPGARQCLVLVLRAFPVGAVPAVLNHEHLDCQPDAPGSFLRPCLPLCNSESPRFLGNRAHDQQQHREQRAGSREQRAGGKGQTESTEQRNDPPELLLSLRSSSPGDPGLDSLSAFRASCVASNGSAPDPSILLSWGCAPSPSIPLGCQLPTISGTSPDPGRPRSGQTSSGTSLQPEGLKGTPLPHTAGMGFIVLG